MAFGAELADSIPLFGTIRHVLANLILSYFRFWARLAINMHTPTVIGIAGAVGKSTARQALYAVLKGYKPTKMIEGNSETGIPLGILGLFPVTYSASEWISFVLMAPFRLQYLKLTDYLLVEMGIDGPFPPKNMEYLLTIVKPHVAILLNESPAHVGNYEIALPGKGIGLSDSEKLDRIMKLITRDDGRIITDSQCRLGITNADDPYIHSLIIKPNENTLVPIYTFGSGKENTVSYDGYTVANQQTTFTYLLNQPQSSTEFTVTFKNIALPQETQSLFAAVILAAQHIGVPTEHIAKSLEGLTLPPGRGSIFSGIKGSQIIDSTYNASSASVLSYLGYLKTLKAQSNRPAVFLFGDMKELGQAGAMEHEKVASHMIGVVDYLYCVGELTQQYILPFAHKHKNSFKDIRWFSTSREAGMAMEELLPESALVLAKGSQLLEEALKFILVDPADTEKLCRQDAFWKQAKFTRGSWVE